MDSQHVRRAHYKQDDAELTGRPTRHDQEEHRTVAVNVKVRPAERDAWKAHAEANGYSVSELVRIAVNARVYGG